MRDPIDDLPDAPLAIAGLIGARFRAEGPATFREACAWVRARPYGANTGRQPDVLFVEQVGTCRSKHSLIALLARELDLPVDQYVGAYRLDESIVEGAGALLAPHGLAYVPQLHCVLKYRDRFVDLTAGNCHGKKQDITEMDAYFRVSPSASEAEHRALYALCVRYYQQTDPLFPWHSVDALRRVARACLAQGRMTCE
jgi:hypothetical protein